MSIQFKCVGGFNLSTATEDRVPLILAALDHIVLWWSSRPLVAALLRFGGPQELQAVLKKIANADYQVDYWNHTELGNMTEKRLSQVTRVLDSNSAAGLIHL